MSITIRKEKGAPNTNTIGFVGEIYEDINTGVRYECVGIYKTTGSKMYGADCDYHWEKIDMIEEKRLPSGIGGGASSWNDLQDKPFEDNTIVYYERHEGYEPLETFDDEGIVMYKISDTPLSADELCGAVVICYSENYGDETYKLATTDIYDMGAYCVVMDGLGFSVLEANDDIPCGRGLWVAGEGMAYVSKFYKESVKKIEPKYLPEGTPYAKQNEDGSKTNTLFVKLYTDDIKLYHDKDFNNPVYKDELKKIVENHFIHLCYNECVLYPIHVSVADIDTFGCVCIYDNISDKSKVFYTDEREEK